MKVMGRGHPSETECLRLMDEYAMLPNIRAHSRRVHDVALLLGEHLFEAGLKLELPLLKAGALLHDIAKTATINNGGDHARLGAEWLSRRGHPAVAEIIREHVCLSRNPEEPWPLREVEIVNYADKRVLHDRVVTLNQRFDDLRQRYGRTEAALSRITANQRRSQCLEQKIFAHITISPDDLLAINEWS
ncbi:MAG TPA: metal-dependent phosphohydrolase [Desulfobacterales bacterium]|nr:metal-dependent phosphohydrolase [Desulfobacterales bacterium]